MKDTVTIHGGDIRGDYRYMETVPSDISLSHCHDVYEILYVMNGSGKYIVEGSEHRVAPRTLMIIRPFAYHCLMLDPGSSYERFAINFPKNAVMGDALKMLENIMGTAEDSGIYYPPGAISSALASVFDRFEIAESLPDEERCAYIRMLLSEIIILLSAAVGDRMMYNEDELGARVIKYLNGNIERDIGLDKLAKRFFVSKYYLCRAFKKHNGISVHGYINQKRIMYAKQLIESGETASGAAYKVGFGDYSAFYRAYVKLVGRSPTQVGEGGEEHKL